MPVAPFLGSKPIPTRLGSRSFAHAQTRRPRTQIFLPLAFTDNSSPDFQSREFERNVDTQIRAAAGSPAPTTADELVEFDTLRDTRRGAPSHSDEASVHTRARTPPTRTHTQPPSTSPVAQTFPQLRLQNHPPLRAARDVPTSYRASLFPFAALSRKPSHPTSRAHAPEQRRPPPLAHRAGRRPALGPARAPAARSARTARLSTTSHARGTPPNLTTVANPSGAPPLERSPSRPLMKSLVSRWAFRSARGRRCRGATV
jgi:hypothetical protein